MCRNAQGPIRGEEKPGVRQLCSHWWKLQLSLWSAPLAYYFFSFDLSCFSCLFSLCPYFFTHSLLFCFFRLSPPYFPSVSPYTFPSLFPPAFHSTTCKLSSSFCSLPLFQSVIFFPPLSCPRSLLPSISLPA